MAQDRSDEIRIKILSQRITMFCDYLTKIKSQAKQTEKSTENNWNTAYAKALDNVSKRAQKIFSGAEDKPVVLED
jgi:hypothetical protein